MISMLKKRLTMIIIMTFPYIVNGTLATYAIRHIHISVPSILLSPNMPTQCDPQPVQTARHSTNPIPLTPHHATIRHATPKLFCLPLPPPLPRTSMRPSFFLVSLRLTASMTQHTSCLFIGLRSKHPAPGACLKWGRAHGAHIAHVGTPQWVSCACMQHSICFRYAS